MKASDYVRRGWCQGVMARDEDGCPYLIADPDARAWCILGAAQLAKLDLPASPPGYENWAQWNDDPHRTQGEVLRMLERIEAGADISHDLDVRA